MQDISVPEARLQNPVKLVVWDLDDTFWTGTLSEEPVTPIAGNIELVKTLAARGIVSSICSKNDHAQAVAELARMGVLDDFVLPSISFQPKGRSIAALIEALQLRPDNVVFIDDNPSVLAEAAFACPGMVCLDSPAKLADQMDGEALRGSPDTELKRLAQYRLLAARYDSRQGAEGNNLAFLRQSEIRIEIDYAVEPHIDRVIELINRSNQLNYTKVRVETDEARQNLLESIKAFGFNAGVVRVWDKYGDYGIVGFFMTLATLREYRLEQFVFSCRIMNMGVEQYVFDYLNRPEIRIAESVANPIVGYPEIDWIENGSKDAAIAELRQFKLVLVGGCDMLQLSTYCSNNSAEFTNRDEHGLIKRLDDPFLILDDPEKVRQSPLRDQIPAFDADDMLALREAVRDADLLVLSLYRMMEINYFRGRDGLTVRLDEDAVTGLLRSDRGLWFIRHFSFVDYSHQERNDLVRRSLERLSDWVKPSCKIVVLFENTRKLEANENERALRELYNDFIAAECARRANLTYVDVNAVTNIDWLFDDGFHMSRQGYYELAQAVKAVLDPN